MSWRCLWFVSRARSLLLLRLTLLSSLFRLPLRLPPSAPLSVLVRLRLLSPPRYLPAGLLLRLFVDLLSEGDFDRDDRDALEDADADDDVDDLDRERPLLAPLSPVFILNKLQFL
jgi:hypothetical protein